MHSHSHKPTKRSPKINPADLADQAGAAMSLGVDFTTRTIYLVGEIVPETSYRFLVALHTLMQQKEEIRVMLSTPGGSEESGYAIYDAIRMAKNDVGIVGIGSVQSIGALIMQAGTVRILTPECRFMIHNGSLDIPGGIGADTLVAIGKEVERGNNRYHRILAERSGLSVDKVRALCMEETYLDARETVLQGFADCVGKYEGGVLMATDLKKGKK